MFEDVQKILNELMSPVLEELDLEVLEFSIKHRNKTIAVSVIADGLTKPITIDQCSRLNKVLTKAIDDQELIHGEYTVEVSSPGLDRPLRSERDFERVVSKRVRFHLKEKILDKVEHEGVVLEVIPGQVIISVKDEPLAIPVAIINKAVQVI
jgi:ribosome maturation factor RimP